MSRLYLVVVVFTCALVISTNPARGDVDSGPMVGENVPELIVLPLTGPLDQKEQDYAAERKGKPTVYLLIPADKFARPVARFIKTLDGKAKDAGDEAYVVAVWMTDDQDKTKEYLPKVQQSLQLDNTALTVYPGGKGGPPSWGIHDNALLTAVTTDGEKATARFGFVSVNETNVPDVLAALKKAAATAAENSKEKK